MVGGGELNSAISCCGGKSSRDTQQGAIPIRILNPSAHTVTLYAETGVAELERIDDIPEEVVGAVGQQELSEEKSKLLQELVDQNGAELTGGQRDKFRQVLFTYSDVFAVSKSDLGRTSKVKHKIHTGEALPIRQAAGRLAPQRRQHMKDLLAGMLKDNVVQPSQSPWASPIVLVQKKDGSIRFCVDYRKLNDQTRKDAHPLPRIDDTLNTLAGSQWFCTLDLLSGYWQVEVAEEDREKTAFPPQKVCLSLM